MIAGPNRRILIVDDMPAIHDDFRKMLAGRQATALDDLEASLFGEPPPEAPAPSFELESAYQGQEALEMVIAARAAQRPFALAFVDMRMPPGWNGVETIERLWEADPELAIVICTAYSDLSRDEVLDRLQRGERLVILRKPVNPAEVVQLASTLTAAWSGRP